MSSITDFLNLISGARYGREVRQAIVDAISQCYEDGKAGVNDLQARRLIESTIAVNENQQSNIMDLLARVSDLEAGDSGGSTSGSTTTEVPSLILDAGIVDSIEVPNKSTKTQAVTFSKEFTEIPHVFCMLMVQNAASYSYAFVSVVAIKSSITQNGFSFTVAQNTGTTRSVTVGWIAIQPITVEVETEIIVPATDDLTQEQIDNLIGLLD